MRVLRDHFGKRVRKAHRLSRQLCPSSPKCPSNGLAQRSPVEIKTACQQPDIEKVLHPAVQLAQLHHGLKFLCYYGLAVVGVQMCRGLIKDHRIGDFHRPRRDDVAESDVDLHGDTCVTEEAVELGADAHFASVSHGIQRARVDPGREGFARAKRASAFLEDLPGRLYR